jgi:hypothetical protein
MQRSAENQGGDERQKTEVPRSRSEKSKILDAENAGGSGETLYLLALVAY